MNIWNQLRIKALWPFYFAALLLILVPLLLLTSPRSQPEIRRRLWPVAAGIRVLHAHAVGAAEVFGSLICRYMLVLALCNSIYHRSLVAVGHGLAAGFVLFSLVFFAGPDRSPFSMESLQESLL